MPFLMLEMNFSAYNVAISSLVPKSKPYELKTSLTQTSIPTALTSIKKIPPILGEIPPRRRRGSNLGSPRPTNSEASVLLTELARLMTTAKDLSRYIQVVYDLHDLHDLQYDLHELEHAKHMNFAEMCS